MSIRYPGIDGNAVAAVSAAPVRELVVGAPTGSASPWRRARRAVVASRTVVVVGPLLVLTAWWLATSVGGVAPQTLASPSTVASTGWSLIRDGQLPEALLVSLRRVALGLLLGVSVGTLLGIASGLSRVGERLVDPIVQMFRTMPALALVPLFILWFGIDERPKVLLVAFAVAFPIYVNLHAGIRGVDGRLVEAGRIFGLGRRRLVTQVVLPGALASWLVGLRFSLGLAWIVLVAAEQINATSGIGALMSNAQNLMQTDVILVGLLVYSLLGLGSDQLVRFLERSALSWRRDLRSL
jgi:sulfonate transport system permease protein